MAGTGVLAVWNDCASGAEENYEKWYQREHLPERLGVPGFVRGRRYEAIRGRYAFFTWYEVECTEILRSQDYAARLSNPTPWTREIMSGTFRNASRTVCHREVLSGEVFGSYALTLKMSRTFDTVPLLDALKKFEASAGLARIERWDADLAPDGGAMVEEEIRGPDQKIDSCVMMETLRQEMVTEIAEFAESQFPELEVGVYRLLCERVAADKE